MFVSVFVVGVGVLLSIIALIILSLVLGILSAFFRPGGRRNGKLFGRIPICWDAVETIVESAIAVAVVFLFFVVLAVIIVFIKRLAF